VSRGRKILLGAGLYVVLLIVIGIVFGSEGKNDEFQPQNEFKLDDWIPIHLGSLNLSVNKAVLYLVIACVLTSAAMIYIAGHMTQRPNRVQTAVEVTYDLTFNNIARGNMDPATAARWFPFVATLFFFILISNLIGYIPLPVNSQETVDIFGVAVPAFSLYAATANLSVPLVLTLVVWFTYQAVGIREHGLRKYLAGWVPAGTPNAMRPFIFGIEVISQLVRIISLSVRLFANVLAGHLLILFMGGGLVVLLGLAVIGIATLPLAIFFFMFEVILIAGLQAFIFATLTSIYIGEATAGGH
jgi:F-type H+-transporting ATPase subunit a